MLDFSFPILFMNIIFSDIFQLFLSNNWNNWSREYYTFIKFVLFIYTCTLEFLLLELLRSMLKICNKKKLALIILHFKININFINLQSWSATLKFRIFPQSLSSSNDKFQRDNVLRYNFQTPFQIRSNPTRAQYRWIINYIDGKIDGQRFPRWIRDRLQSLFTTYSGIPIHHHSMRIY